MEYIEGDPEGSRRIYLSGKHSDKYALVDEKWYEELSKYKWYYINNKYVRRCTSDPNKKILMHRQIMGVINDPTLEIDHINHNGLDNREGNLRTCTGSENKKNSIKPAFKTYTEYKGICQREGRDGWEANITNNKQQIYLGMFETEIIAALAYDKAARELFGEFACLNFPECDDYSELEKYKRKKGLIPYKGVSFRDGKYQAIIHHNYEIILLGRYDNPKDAAICYDYHARQKFGKEAILNFPDIIDYDEKYIFKSPIKASQYPGVTKHSNRWMCRITENGKRRSLGTYDTEEKANEVREKYLASKAI